MILNFLLLLKFIRIVKICLSLKLTVFFITLLYYRSYFKLLKCLFCGFLYLNVSITYIHPIFSQQLFFIKLGYFYQGFPGKSLLFVYKVYLFMTLRQLRC